MTYIPALTALRFVAAFLVMISHLRFTLPAFDGSDEFDVLFSAVGLFFVLSGFVLARAHPDGPADLRAYALARVARIVPMHWATALAWVALFGLGLDGLEDPGRTAAIIANLFLLHAFVPLNDVALSLNPVSWSLSAEMFFYALLPALVVSARARWAAILLPPLAAVVWWGADGPATVAGTWPEMPFLFPPLRLTEFALGVVLARNVGSLDRWLRDLGPGATTAVEVATVALAVAAFAVPRLSAPDFANLLQAPAFVLLVGVIASGRGAVSAALGRSRALETLGRASYALYLCHFLVLQGLALAAPDLFARPAMAVPAMVLAVLVSLAAWRLVEEPARRGILWLVEGRARTTSA